MKKECETCKNILAHVQRNKSLIDELDNTKIYEGYDKLAVNRLIHEYERIRIKLIDSGVKV